jgi:sugar phosphate isomerase/epimerase
MVALYAGPCAISDPTAETRRASRPHRAAPGHVPCYIPCVLGHPRLSVNCICSWPQSLPEDLAMWQDLGIDHVALIMQKIEPVGWETARELITEAGLRLSTIFGPIPIPLDTDPRTRQRAAEQVAIAKTLGFAADVGAKSVYLCTGSMASLTWEEAADAFCEAIAPLTPLADSLGVLLAVEPTNSLLADVSFVYCLRDALDLARAAGVKVVLDFFSCWYERGLQELVRKNIDQIALVQLSDFVIGTHETGNRVVPGDGDLPLSRLLSMVLDAGYQGPFDLEIMGPAMDSEGYPSAIRRSVERASELLDRLGA